MARGLPEGVVTLLFTDIEGSTSLLHAVGPDEYADLLASHRNHVRAAITAYDGVEVDTQGDAFFVAFASARDAVAAAAAAQESLAGGPVRVRMGLHTGQPRLAGEGYVGVDVHLGARVAAAGHGMQVLMTAATAAGIDVDLTDLGEHRLKDFADPVPIFQLGRRKFPPLRTVSTTNLPQPASEFVGRDEELGAVVSALEGGSRLLTLVGPGGTGKTRLAIAAATELVPRCKAGVFWVPLADVRDPRQVMSTIGRTIGAAGDVAAAIGARQMLLVVDNFEQVMAAAGDLANLVRTCAALRLIVTSRERLRVSDETIYEVPALADHDAVALFCLRSGLPPDEAVGALCTRLDNLPLAVELAAARASVMSPQQILDRLGQRLDFLKGSRDADARHRTLRAAISWSVELLNDSERDLMMRLACFLGGCTLEAAEVVAAADIDDLQSLVDKSLVRRTGERFWMLETVREFAVEQLEASGAADELRRRHADYYLAFVEQAAPHIRELVLDPEWMPRVDAEMANLFAAFDFFAAAGDGEAQLRMVGALSALCGVRGYNREFSPRILAALGATEGSRTLARATALNAAADLCGLGHGDAAKVAAWATPALALHRQFGNLAGVGESLHLLSHAAADLHDYAQALEFAQQSEHAYLQAGDHGGTALAVWLKAWATNGSGDQLTARRYYEEALQRGRDLDIPMVQTLVLYSLSRLVALMDGPAAALPLVRDSYRVASATGNRWRVAGAVFRLSWLAALMELPQEAVRLFASGSQLMAEMGGTAEHRAAEDEDILARTKAALSPSEFDQAWAEGADVLADELMERTLAELGYPVDP